MTGRADDDTDSYVRSLERIASDPKARRELLWIRAKSKADERDARSLLAIDPGIRERLAALYDLEGLDDLYERERRDAFEALWDAHYATLCARLASRAAGRRRGRPIEPRQLRALFDVLDRELAVHGCDNTCARTKRWLAENDLPVAKVLAWLRARGGYCDCEVVMNVEPTIPRVVREQPP